jgi:hypothetical protein
VERFHANPQFLVDPATVEQEAAKIAAYFTAQ